MIEQDIYITAVSQRALFQREDITVSTVALLRTIHKLESGCGDTDVHISIVTHITQKILISTEKICTDKIIRCWL